MNISDIRFLIYQNLDIKDLKACFSVDIMSTIITSSPKEDK